MSIGTSYFGNRVLRHVAADMEGLAADGFTGVLHTYSENDLAYYRESMGRVVEASHAAGRIREEFYQSSATLLRRKEGVTMSIGVSSLKTNRAANADQLVAQADAALYKSKQQGRNRVSIADVPTVNAA